jgi:hypothetical protein
VEAANNPLPIPHGWTFLAQMLNALPANRLTATALEAFLKVGCGWGWGGLHPGSNLWMPPADMQSPSNASGVTLLHICPGGLPPVGRVALLIPLPDVVKCHSLTAVIRYCRRVLFIYVSPQTVAGVGAVTKPTACHSVVAAMLAAIGFSSSPCMQ